MKALVATAVSLLLIPTLMSAQNADHPYRGQGYLFFGLDPDCNRLYSCSVIYHVGGGGEGFLYKGFGAGIEAGYAHWGPYGNDAYIGSGDFFYHFGRHAPRGKVDPFVLGGVTGYFPTSEGRGAPAGNFGGGVNIWLGRQEALRLEIRDHVTQAGRYWSPAHHTHYVSFRIGVTFR